MVVSVTLLVLMSLACFLFLSPLRGKRRSQRTSSRTHLNSADGLIYLRLSRKAQMVSRNSVPIAKTLSVRRPLTVSRRQQRTPSASVNAA